MIKYIASALGGVIMAGITAGLPMYASFVTMQANVAQLSKSVELLSTQVQVLTIEVTKLSVQQEPTIRGLLNGP